MVLTSCVARAIRPGTTTTSRRSCRPNPVGADGPCPTSPPLTVARFRSSTESDRSCRVFCVSVRGGLVWDRQRRHRRYRRRRHRRPILTWRRGLPSLPQEEEAERRCPAGIHIGQGRPRFSGLERWRGSGQLLQGIRLLGDDGRRRRIETATDGERAARFDTPARPAAAARAQRRRAEIRRRGPRKDRGRIGGIAEPTTPTRRAERVTRHVRSLMESRDRTTYTEAFLCGPHSLLEAPRARLFHR